MSEKRLLPSQQLPKDAQVIISILKDNGVEYEARNINQLLEYCYRYISCTLEDAKVYSNHARKKVIDLDDVKLATEVVLDKSFTNPLHRSVMSKLAEQQNSMPLPPIKAQCGPRLPPDRYCLTAANFKLRSTNVPKKMTKSALERPVTKVKTTTGATGGGVKRQSAVQAKQQTVTIPKPTIKFVTTTKPKDDGIKAEDAMADDNVVEIKMDDDIEHKAQHDEMDYDNI